MSGWTFGFTTVGMVLLWVLVILAIAALTRYLLKESRSAGSTGGRTPATVLSERFARGEVDTKEYRERLEALREAGHG
ncbi:SHOCT domain-containing protein [Nocardiopsis metallicus]